MVQSQPLTEQEIEEYFIGSDDTPVDNELQNLIPNLLLVILNLIWGERQDWFFAVDMGVYDNRHHRYPAPIVPDGFLSLGVARRLPPNGRKSYILSEEQNIPPIFVLEVVSHTYRGEYEEKMEKYAELGVLYYAIYNTRKRKGHKPLEVYQLVNGEYIPLTGEPVWMEEIGLGIGRAMGVYDGSWEREWLYWYDQQGERFPTPEEVLQATQAEALNAQQQALNAQQQAISAQQEVEEERRRRETLEATLERYRQQFGDLP